MPYTNPEQLFQSRDQRLAVVERPDGPMGWWTAFFSGVVYGLVVGGVTYGIWTAVTQSVPGKYGEVIAGFLFVTCFLTALVVESEERSKIKKGQARDIRKEWR